MNPGERVRMKRLGSVFRCGIVGVLVLCGVAVAAEPGLPVFKGEKTVALVNGEPITLKEFQRTLESLHKEMGEKQAAGGRRFSELLDRLINGKLILQESRNIGLDALPEVRETVQWYERKCMRMILLTRQVKDTRPDPRKVEKVYRESIREVKVRSYLFGKEEDANQAGEEIRSGSDFDNVMKRMVSEGKAKGNEDAGYIKGKDLLPEISEAISKLKSGGVSPVLKVPAGAKGEFAYTILKLEGIRFPENPEAKEKARWEVLQEQRLVAIRKYVGTLKKKYAKIDKATVDSLDYEAKEPGIEALLQDRRIVAEIRGEKPIRVEDLSGAIQQKFFHGVQQAASSKKVNKEVPEVLDEMVNTRVLDKEALRRKIDRTPECREQVKAFEEGILFGMFVEKAINPGIKVDDAVVRKHYDDHLEEFSAPERIRGEDLAFTGREDASDALEKLRRGADFKWVMVNAPGQAGEKTRERVFPPEGTYIARNDLTASAGEAVAGAGPGEYRLYESPKGQFLVLHVLEVVPPKPYPFESVQGKIREKMYGEEQQKSVEEWAAKLRAASEIKVFATDEMLKKIFVPSGGAPGGKS